MFVLVEYGRRSVEVPGDSRNSRRLSAVLFTTTAFAALSLSAGAQAQTMADLSPLAGETITVDAAQAVGSLSGPGTINVGNTPLTVGADNSSSAFSGSIVSNALAYVGSWRVNDGPAWGTHPPVYSGQEAAALIFGGNASDYSISTVSDKVEDINHKAWVDGFADHATYATAPADESFKADVGAPGYSSYGDYSAYVLDGSSNVNYAFAERTGTGGLIKAGSGTLTLTGVNTYVGATTVAGGTLALGGGQALDDASAVTVEAGATLHILDAETIGSLAGAGGVLANATVTVGANNAHSQFDGVISGVGGLVKSGSGTLTLTGANNYTGGTVVAGGRLVGTTTSLQGDIVNNAIVEFAQTEAGSYAGVLSGTGTILKSGGGMLTLTGANGYTGGTVVADGRLVGTTASLQGDIFNYATVEFAQAEAGSYAGVLSGTGGLVKSGGGTLTLSGANSYVGATTVAGGTLALGGGQALADASAVTVGGGATLHILDAETIGSLAGAGDMLADAAVTVGGNNIDSQFDGTIAGAGSLIKSGSGTLTLTGANSYTGGTVVSGGRLVGNATSLQGDIVNNAVIEFAQAEAGSYAGVLSGTGGLVKSGGGTLTLTGANSYTGGTVVADGRLVGNATSLQGGIVNNAVVEFAQADAGSYAGVLSGTGGLVKSGGGTLTLTGANSYTGGTVVADGRLVGNATSLQGDIVNNAVVEFAQAEAGSYAGVLSGAGGLVKSGGSTLTLTGANSYTGGTVVADGTLALGGGQALADASAVAVEGGATLHILDAETIGSLAGAGDMLADATITVGANNANSQFDGVISGVGGLIKSGSGTLTLTGANSYTGGTVVSGGRLVGTTTSLQGDIVNNAVVEFAQADAGSYASVLSGTGGLIKSGSGTLTLTGANSYAGGTVVSDGRLVGNATSLQGDIVNNAVVEFAQADAGSYAGVLSGTGGLIKSGSGTLTLTGANSYTGGTVVSGGRLVGTTASLQGDIVNNAVLEFAQTEAGSYAGVLSGTGGLIKSGSGTLTLTGANSYTGGTVVADGRLVGTTTSLQGDIVNNAVVEFAQTSDGVYDSVISGSGRLVKTGAGVLTLNGVNSYTGGTLINGGTIVAGNQDALGTGPVSFNGGVLRFAYAGFLDRGVEVQSGALVLDTGANTVNLRGSQSGAGSLTKIGTGQLTLTGDSSISGPTTVREGRLAVNGSLANSLATVEAGAEIGGNGIVGGLIVRNRGIAAPGNSIGQLNAATYAVFEPGSFYRVEVDASGASDRIAVATTATLQGGQVQVLAAGGGTYRPSTDYVILTAAEGVTGQFEGVETDLAYLTPELFYSENQVVLQLTRNDLSFASAAATRNQRSAANAADQAFRYGSPVYAALVGTNAGQAQQAFDQLSGEAYASAVTTAIADARIVRETLLNRTRQAVDVEPGHVALWSQALASWGHTNSNGNAGKLDRETEGFLIGGEARLGEKIWVGVAGGHTKTNFDVGARASTGEIDALHIDVYGGANVGALRVRAGIGYAFQDYDLNRSIAFGSFSDRLTARYDGTVVQTFGEAGYRFDFGRVALEPFAGLTALWSSTDGFAEEGGSAALDVRSQDQDVTFSTLGLRTEVHLGSRLPLTVSATAAWQRAFEGIEPTAMAGFRSGGDLFSAAGAPVDRNSLNLDAGINWQVTKAVALGANYTGMVGKRAEDHGVKGTLTVKF